MIEENKRKVAIGGLTVSLIAAVGILAAIAGAADESTLSHHYKTDEYMDNIIESREEAAETENISLIFNGEPLIYDSKDNT